MKVKISSMDELKKLKTADLDKYVKSIDSQLTELNHLVATNKDKQTHIFKQLKKSKARANTLKTNLLKEKEQ